MLLGAALQLGALQAAVGLVETAAAMLRVQLLISGVLLTLLSWCPTPTIAAVAATECSSGSAAAEVAHAVRSLCGDVPTEEALQAVRLLPEVAGAAAPLLAAAGILTVTDLKLLAGAPEAEELMTELRKAGALSIGDRAKLRLLIGGAEDGRVNKVNICPIMNAAREDGHLDGLGSRASATAGDDKLIGCFPRCLYCLSTTRNVHRYHRCRWDVRHGSSSQDEARQPEAGTG